MVMACFRWVFGAGIALTLAIIASSNLHDIEIYITPLHAPVQLQLYVIILTALSFGFLMGVIFMAVFTLSLRFRHMKQGRYIKRLERDMNADYKKDKGTFYERKQSTHYLHSD